MLVVEGVGQFDAELYTGSGPGPARIPHALEHIHVVEVGYCNDTRWEEKDAAKHTQHGELAAKLEQRLGEQFGDGAAAGANDGNTRTVKRHSIPLGVSGFALQHNLDTLIALGLEHRAARQCLAAVSTWSQQKLYEMVTIRRQRECKVRQLHKRGAGG